MIDKQQSYPGIDLFKFILSFFVIGIHFAPFEATNPTLDLVFSKYICKVAVPFFFITSGFFCFRKFDLSKFSFKDVMPYLKRLILLYTIWSVINLPKKLYSLVIKHGVAPTKIFLPLLKGFFIGGWSMQLWFLVSFIYTVIIVSFLLSKKKSIKSILIISAILFIFGHINNFFRLNNLVSKETLLYTVNHAFLSFIENPRDSIFMGLFYFSIGVSISKEQIQIPKLGKSAIFYVISMILLAIEIFIRSNVLHLDYDNEMSISLAFVSTFLFFIGLQLSLQLSNGKKLRAYSTLIFCSHVIFGKGLSLAESFLNIKIPNDLIWFILVCIMSWLFSVIVYSLSQRPRLKFLNYLY